MDKRIMTAGFFAGALMMALPLSAAAADSTNTVSDQARQEAREIRNDADRKVQDIRTDANRQMQDVREDMRDARNDMRDARNSNLTEEEHNKITMDRLNAKEDRQSVGEYLDDAGVTAKVKSSFVGQKGLDSLDIKVVTVDGTVTLMGDVDNAAQVGLAESVAKGVEGVRSVDNKLVVKP